MVRVERGVGRRGEASDAQREAWVRRARRGERRATQVGTRRTHTRMWEGEGRRKGPGDTTHATHTTTNKWEG